jgi:hypothetical protein
VLITSRRALFLSVSEDIRLGERCLIEPSRVRTRQVSVSKVSVSKVSDSEVSDSEVSDSEGVKKGLEGKSLLLTQLLAASYIS